MRDNILASLSGINILTRLHVGVNLAVALMAGSFAAWAQAPNDSKVYDHSVWYNARRGESSAMNQLGVWYYSGNHVERDYNQAFQWWRRAALQQNVKAIANLGVCYQYGRGVEQDSIAAMQLYVTAIDRGQQELLQQRAANAPHNVFDDMLTGYCYERGIGCLRDLDQAAQYYGYAAERGSVDGMVNAGRVHLRSGEPVKALKRFEQAAARGDIYATYWVGKLRLGANGVAADKPTAVASIRKAAEAGLPEAFTALGTLYFSGEAIGHDMKEALKWLKAGAQAGDNTGMWTYGQALKQAQNYERALFWMQLAAEAGYADEFEALLKHTPNDPFTVYARASQRYAAGDYNGALSDLKQISKNGNMDVKVLEAMTTAGLDPVKGAKALEKFSSDSPQAAYALAQMYMQGSGVAKDTNKTIRLLRQAARAGYGKAQDALGTIYYEGHYATIDRKEAQRLYREAYEQRELSSEGAKNLSVLSPQMAPKLKSLSSNYSVLP